MASDKPHSDTKPAPEDKDAAISDKGKADGETPAPVRPAGPGAMRDPPEHWDEEDEDSDESFPASDPPANY